MDVNPGRMMDLVRALRFIQLGNREDFYHASRSLLVHRREDLPLFDEAFARFWRKPSGDVDEIRLPGPRRAARRRRPHVIPPPLRARTRDGEDPDRAESEEEERRLLEANRTYSPREVLRHRDFADLSAEELDEIQRLISELVWQLGERRTRRFRAGRGTRLDLRRTLRRSLLHGGEILQWSRREPRRKPRPLVVLADVSGSMERYTRLLLHFVYSLARGLDQPVEAFVFGTRLTCVTRPLRGRNVERALEEVSRLVPDWTGGTRIGDALKTFNFEWGRRVLGRGAVVLIISDGWDRGDPDLVRREMARLQRSCYRLIWLNPLLGSPSYEPLTRGMQAALPYVDDFLPVHNLASLEQLAETLSRLEGRRYRRLPTIPVLRAPNSP